MRKYVGHTNGESEESIACRQGSMQDRDPSWFRNHFTVCNSSCGKVMFSQASVILSMAGERGGGLKILLVQEL